jgi:hypothetical protein
MNKLSTFNFGDFRKWIQHQDLESVEMNKPSPKGLAVESKVSPKHILTQIKPEEGDAKELVKNFIEDGGIVRGIDGTNFLIEVKSGSFYVNRRYVKRA